MKNNLLKLPKTIILISIVMAIYNIGWGITSPFLPIYFKEILGTYTNVGIVTALASFFGIFWSLPIGELIDRISKKRVIKYMLLAYLPFSYIFLAIKTLLGFTVFRIYHSFIATSLWLSSSAYIRSHSPKRKTAESIGFFDSMHSSVLFIGPILGGLLIGVFKYKIFYAISIFAFIAFLFSLTLKSRKGKPLFKEIRYVMNKDKIVKKVFIDYFKNKKLLNLSIFLLLFSIAVSFVGMLLPLFLKKLGASFFQIGVISAFFYLPLMFETFFSATKNKRAGLLSALLVGSLLFFFIFLTADLTLIFILSILLGLSFSFVNPILQGKITETMPKNEIGELSGVIHATGCLGNTIGPLTAGLVSDMFGINIMFLLGGAIFCSLFFLSLNKKFYI